MHFIFFVTFFFNFFFFNDYLFRQPMAPYSYVTGPTARRFPYLYLDAIPMERPDHTVDRNGPGRRNIRRFRGRNRVRIAFSRLYRLLDEFQLAMESLQVDTGRIEDLELQITDIISQIRAYGYDYSQ